MAARFFIVIILFLSPRGKAQIEQGDIFIYGHTGYWTRYNFDPGCAYVSVPYSFGIAYAKSDRMVWGFEFAKLFMSTKESFGYHYNNDQLAMLYGIKVHWLNNDEWSLYSGASGGLGFNGVTPVGSHAVSQHDFITYEYQLRLLGYKRTFAECLALHAELGYGVQGILGVGVEFKLSCLWR